MKNLKKKIVALGLCLATMASSMASMSASAAAKYENWRPTYAPISGTFYASKSAVIVQDLCWDSSQLSELSGFLLRHTEEFEFRPSIAATSVWNGATTTDSNLPRAYFEGDDPNEDSDDATIGCGDVSQIRSGTAYYGVMGLNTASGFTNNKLTYNFEAELCEHVPGASEFLDDYLPLKYSRFRDWDNVATFGEDYSWYNW